MRAFILALAVLSVSWPAAAVPDADREARISLDVKDADITDIVKVLSEVGGFQVVFDPGVSCRLTLKLNEVRWVSALDVALKSCNLGRDEENEILRIAPTARLTAERADSLKLQEARELARKPTVTTFRLSYARAAEMAPLVKRFLSPRGEVVFDSRTNTLIVID